MEKKIFGRYETDSNFITVYSADDNRMYTIARATGEYGSVGVGEAAACGGIMTQEWFDEHAAACSREGSFELPA